MARVTVEDCIEKVSNRFELVHVASQRAREISAGSRLTVDRDNDKNPVVALREIASEGVEVENLKDALVRNNQRYVPEEDENEELIDFMEGEADWADAEEAALEAGEDEGVEITDTDGLIGQAVEKDDSEEADVDLDDNMIG